MIWEGLNVSDHMTQDSPPTAIYTTCVYVLCSNNTQVCHYAPVQVRRSDQHADDLPNTPSSKTSLIIKHKKVNNTFLYLFYCWAIFFVPLGSLTPTVTKIRLVFSLLCSWGETKIFLNLPLTLKSQIDIYDI